MSGPNRNTDEEPSLVLGISYQDEQTFVLPLGSENYRKPGDSTGVNLGRLD